MFRTASTITLLAATAAVPATAAASLGGAPELTRVDAHHAQLRFAAHDVPRNADGTLAATITFAGGRRVSNLKPTGNRHGEDPIYTATVTSSNAWRMGVKYTVRFRFAGGKTTSARVKLH